MTPALATPDTDTTLTTARTAPNAQPRTAAAGRAVPVAVSHGDGIGPEIMDATLRVLEAGGAAIDQRPITVGKAAYEAGHTSGITPEAWDTIRQTGVLLKAPITTPQGGGYKSLNVTLRKTLGLYANTRPCVAYHPFVSTRHPGMDVVIVRENEEDTYGGIEHQQTREVTQCLKLITRPGTERICRYAFAYAKAHGRKKVTCFVKDNIMKQTDGLFRKVFEEVAAEHPDIESSSMIIDIGTAKLADDPSQFDVIVTANLYGDIISDVAAEVAGSVGLVGTANIGPSSAMFEAIHGSAPDIAGKGIANPSGLLLSAVQMLVHLGQNGAAERIHNAWLRTIEDGVHTGDVYREGTSSQKVGTAGFAEAVIARLGQRPETLSAVAYAGRPPMKLAAEPTPPAEKIDKQLVGVDVFCDWAEPGREPAALAERLQAAAPDSLKLSMITNRGTKVWPGELPETFRTDHWRCRFTPPPPEGPEAPEISTASGERLKKSGQVRHSDIVALLQSLDQAGIDFIKTEHLYTFDGKPGYSLGQGE